MTYLPATVGLEGDKIRDRIPPGYPPIPASVRLPMYLHGKVTLAAELAIYAWSEKAIPFAEICNFFGTDNKTIRTAIKHHYDGTHLRLLRSAVKPDEVIMEEKELPPDIHRPAPHVIRQPEPATPVAAAPEVAHSEEENEAAPPAPSAEPVGAEADPPPEEEETMAKRGTYHGGRKPRILTAAEQENIKKALQAGKADWWVSKQFHISADRAGALREQWGIKKPDKKTKAAPAPKQHLPAAAPPPAKTAKLADPRTPLTAGKDEANELTTSFMAELEQALKCEVLEVSIVKTDNSEKPYKTRIRARIETWVEAE